MAKNKPPKFRIKIDMQCGSCGALTHLNEDAPPKFCPCCGAAMERFCLACGKKADMFFEEWWPEDDECLRTYSPARRCGRCNAILDPEKEDRFDKDEGPSH
ncbi:MAG: hypothetical protein ACYCPQ_06210 [Elusimicrobiota bacterium]